MNQIHNTDKDTLPAPMAATAERNASTMSTSRRAVGCLASAVLHSSIWAVVNFPEKAENVRNKRKAVLSWKTTVCKNGTAGYLKKTVLRYLKQRSRSGSALIRYFWDYRDPDP